MSENLPVPVLDSNLAPEQEARLVKIAAKDNRSYTKKEFYRAAERGDVGLMNALYKSGFTDVDQHFRGDVFHWSTPLEGAAKAGKMESVRWLVAKGACVEPYCYKDYNQIQAVNHQGSLYLAVHNNHWDVAKYLLNAGANPAVKDHASLLTAIKRGNLEIAELMRQKLPDVLTPLLIANMKEVAKTGGIDVSEIIKDRSRPQIKQPVPEPVIIKEPSPWKKTGALEITLVEEKSVINSCVKDIFNFKSRERMTIVENLELKGLAVLRENFDDIKNRTILERACDEFISQDGKIDKTAIMTRGFVARDKQKLT